MPNPISEIEKILHEEIELYTKIYELEEQKSDAIISKDGSLLESASMEQEKLLSRISILEEKRNKQIGDYANKNRLDDFKSNLSLKDVVLLMDEDSSHRLLSLGMDLKKILVKLESLFNTNHEMINDNMEFFNLLLSGLKSSISVNTGYGEKGMEEPKMAQSLIFNKRA